MKCHKRFWMSWGRPGHDFWTASCSTQVFAAVNAPYSQEWGATHAQQLELVVGSWNETIHFKQRRTNCLN